MKRSKTSISSAKHYAKNKEAINKKRREAARLARLTETPEQRKKRTEARRKSDEARKLRMLEAVKTGTMETETMLKCGNGNANAFEKEKIEGVYTTRKHVRTVRYIEYEREFDTGGFVNSEIPDGRLTVIKGRGETGADGRGEFAYCKETSIKEGGKSRRTSNIGKRGLGNEDDEDGFDNSTVPEREGN